MGYIGSVRFFKNMILAGVIVGIAVPTGLSLRYREEARAARESNAALLEERDQLNIRLAEESLLREAVIPMTVQAPLEPEAETMEAETLEAECPAYQQLYPDFYAPEPVTADVREDRVIYLTFDDGPSPRTDEILELLDREDIKATFFVVGQTDEANKQRMRDIVDRGHTLAMHTYSHSYKTIYSGVEPFLEDMYAIFTQIRETTGVTPSIFRFPGGSINSHNYGIYQEINAEMLRRGFIPHDWNLSSGDAASPTPTSDQIIRNVVGGAAKVDRGVVLMHDSSGHQTTVGALQGMIDGLREQGFTFDRLTAQTKPVLFSYRN